MIKFSFNNKIYILNNLILFNSASGTKMEELSSFDKIIVDSLNTLYNKIERCECSIYHLFIADLQRKLKENLNNKTAFFIPIETDSFDKKYYGTNANLYINEKYFDNYIRIKDAQKKEMQKGVFYYDDLITLDFKNIIFYYKDYCHKFYKTYQEIDRSKYYFRDITVIDDEIKKDYSKYGVEIANKKSNYIKALKQKKQEGYNYYIFSCFENSTDKNVSLKLFIYTHEEKSNRRLDFEKLSKYIKDNYYIDIYPDNLTKLFEGLNIDINAINQDFKKVKKED